jgi:hypothetical protein
MLPWLRLNWLSECSNGEILLTGKTGLTYFPYDEGWIPVLPVKKIIHHSTSKPQPWPATKDSPQPILYYRQVSPK